MAPTPPTTPGEGHGLGTRRVWGLVNPLLVSGLTVPVTLHSVHTLSVSLLFLHRSLRPASLPTGRRDPRRQPRVSTDSITTKTLVSNLTHRCTDRPGSNIRVPTQTPTHASNSSDLNSHTGGNFQGHTQTTTTLPRHESRTRHRTYGSQKHRLIQLPTRPPVDTGRGVVHV